MGAILIWSKLAQLGQQSLADRTDTKICLDHSQVREASDSQEHHMHFDCILVSAKALPVQYGASCPQVEIFLCFPHSMQTIQKGRKRCRWQSVPQLQKAGSACSSGKTSGNARQMVTTFLCCLGHCYDVIDDCFIKFSCKHSFISFN